MSLTPIDTASEDDEKDYLSVEQLLEIRRRYDQRVADSTVKPIEQFDLATGDVLRRYKNLASVASSVGASSRAVQKVLTGSSKDAFGYGWRIYEGPDIDSKRNTPFCMCSFVQLMRITKVKAGLPFATSSSAFELSSVRPRQRGTRSTPKTTTTRT